MFVISMDTNSRNSCNYLDCWCYQLQGHSDSALGVMNIPLCRVTM